MKNEKLTREVKELAYGKGADMVGVAPVDRFQEAPKGCHPLDIFPKCKSVISIGRRFVMGIIDELEDSAGYRQVISNPKSSSRT
jgi:epoxyqueuosine reductase QueG